MAMLSYSIDHHRSLYTLTVSTCFKLCLRFIRIIKIDVVFLVDSVHQPCFSAFHLIIVTSITKLFYQFSQFFVL